jgi:UDP-GlcNAc:undecaprenyl-phosphate/decaprenyl-phosphate GlcNAc-1-phosphate transferase
MLGCPNWLRIHRQGLQQQTGSLWFLLGAATLLMLVGLVDDRRGLGLEDPSERPVRGGSRLRDRAGLAIDPVSGSARADHPPLGHLDCRVINSFNMLDNMDGLSSGIATIASTAVGHRAVDDAGAERYGDTAVVRRRVLAGPGRIAAGISLAQSAGSPIFMGDAGSYFVGFCVAVSTLLATYSGYEGEAQHAVLAPLVVMAVPLYDTITVIWIRLREGRSPFQADRNHFSHRLVELGFTKVQAVLTIYLTTLTCGLGALLLRRVDAFGAAVILLIVVCILALIAILESPRRKV